MSRVNIQLTQKQPEGGRDVLAVPYGPSGNGIVFQRDKGEVFVGGQLSQHRLGKDGIAAVESQLQHQLLHGIRKFDVLRVAAVAGEDLRKLVPQLPVHGGYIILFAGKLAAVQGRIAGQVALAIEHYVLAQLAYLSTQQGGGILQRDQLQLQGKVQLFLLQAFFQGGKIPKMKLTAVYSIPASVLRSTVTVEGGTAKSTLGKGSDIPAEIGTEVEITATPYDAEKYPGMEFVEWEIKYPDSFYEKFPDGIPENLQLKLNNAKSAATTFKMPAYPVKLIAHWSASAVAGPDEPIDEDFGVEPAPMDTTGGAIAAVALGGAAVWGGYEIATRIILNDLLPEGAAIPANRGQLALLIWTEKGKPEPAAQPAFADVADPDMAKAAQWCTEQGTMATKGDRFEPEGWTPKFRVIEVWNKAFPKQ